MIFRPLNKRLFHMYIIIDGTAGKSSDYANCISNSSSYSSLEYYTVDVSVNVNIVLFVYSRPIYNSIVTIFVLFNSGTKVLINIVKLKNVVSCSGV